MAESKAIYLGSGKSVTGKYGEFFNVTLNLNKVKDNPQVVENFKGNHNELWHHVSGCRQWFKVSRNTFTHEILETSKIDKN